MKHLNEKYSQLLKFIDDEFERNVSLHGSKIKCSKGCFKCCFQKFRITLLDAYIIALHIESTGEKERNELISRSEKYLSSNDSALKPCPALDTEGSCLIYEARPVVCRRYGPPVFDYKNPEKIISCELNFADGEEIIDDKLIEKQTHIGTLWDDIKTEFKNLTGNEKNYSIPEAIKNYTKILSEIKNAGEQ